MTQERQSTQSEISKMIDLVEHGSLEQVKIYPPSTLLSARDALGNNMLRLSVSNHKYPDVFLYLYNSVFKPSSPEATVDYAFPLVIKAAGYKNTPVLYFLAAKGAELRPTIFDDGKTEQRSVFSHLRYKDNELLYEQLLAIEAKHKPTLNYVYTHNMNLIRKKAAVATTEKSTGIFSYIGSFWHADKEIKATEPRDIMHTLMTKSLAEVKKIPADILARFKSAAEDTAFSDASPLHFALKNMINPEVFNYLYQEIFKLDSPNQRLLINGISLLVYAASFNNHSAITFLVERGANLQDKDPYGKTALEIITACDPEFANSLTVAPIANADKTATRLLRPSPLADGTHRRTTNKNYGDIHAKNANNDLRTPLLVK
jgi:hypothetical protein